MLDLQTIAQNAGHSVPLLIAIDQENGGVNSLYDETYIRQFPSAMGMAAAGSKKLAKDVARATALELNSCGINWILGPVLDVLTNARNQPLGTRSVGDDPLEVSAYGIECMEGYQEAGLATCAKHFPSYGNLEYFGGPHTNVPTITDSLESLSQNALVPFRNAIAKRIDSMMVGGVAMSSSGVNVMHACLSEQIVRDLLRTEMRFEGVVVSECLEMEALSRNIGISGGTVMAFKAGCDVILTCRSLPAQEEAINGLKAGLDNGMFERFRVQESVERVLSMKLKYTSWERAFAPPGIDNLLRLQQLHTTLSTAAYNKSITIVRDQKRFLPVSKLLKSEEELLLLTPVVKPLPTSAGYRLLEQATNDADEAFAFDTNVSVTSGEKVFRRFGRWLAQGRNGKVSHTSYTANGVRPMHETLLQRASAVIVVTADAGRNMYQNAFAKHIAMMCKLSMASGGQYKEKPCIVVAVSSPFDFAADRAIGTYICTYDFTDIALNALIKVIYGELVATGTLPGTFGQKHQSKPARQQWLVETFNEDRDAVALNTLLTEVVRDMSPASSLLQNAKTGNFLLRQNGTEEAHFVVRNSSTKELFGFCATYFSKMVGVGSIAVIIVHPARRKQSIGHSLHDRAMRAFLQRKGTKKFELGSRLPGIFLGIPKADYNEYRALRQWFAKLGWNVAHSTPVCSLILGDLNAWTAPEGLGKALTSPDVKYDLVHGAEYTQAVLDHLKGSARTDLLDIYDLALRNKEASGVIRAKRAADGNVVGTLLLHRADSKFTSYIPGFGNDMSKGCISAPVISPAAPERHSMLQGLVLLGIRQLKRQGVRNVIFDYVRDDANIKYLYELGFQMHQAFDEVSGDPVQWTMLSPR